MIIIQQLLHLFLPRESNNHKAKLLHTSSLLIISVVLVISQVVLSILPKFGPSILGYAANISPEEVVRLTNEKRIAAGLSTLTYNSTLAGAAYTKGTDMINRDYWAHVAPDGTQPWKFFSDFGYKYRYAGENLARDFTNATSAVDAWMNSPTHRENILNSKYKEIGIGVVEGDLAGVDTTIIVQFFGTSYQDKIIQPIAQIDNTEYLSTPKPVVTSKPVLQKTPSANLIPLVVISPSPFTTPTTFTQVLQADKSNLGSSGNKQTVLVSPFTTTKTISLAVVGLLIFVFLVDGVIVSKRKIARIGGRTIAHLAFFGMILTIVFILRAGKIL